ncbi:hypothetical protein OG285_32410 [Streptomyces sp. NBC_01471]|uniref:hypothetical protein n=1 Tax=Streptomyces sp. NBC_01471 TaxID=2903879 RepID=UPI00324FE372
MSFGILIAVGLVLLLFWFTLTAVHRGKIVDLGDSYRRACKVGDTARADQLEAELRDICWHHAGGLVGGVAGNPVKNTSLIGKADSGLGMTSIRSAQLIRKKHWKRTSSDQRT